MIPSKTLDRFLCAFANHGWPNPNVEETREATANWLQANRSFRRMIPAAYGNPLLSRIGYWQGMLRMLWGLRESKRKNFAVFLVALYSGFILATGYGDDWLSSLGSHYKRVLGRLSEHNDPRIGLKPDGFMQVLRRALEVAPQMQACKNPECGHPFFLARRSSDKYCCKQCALWGKRKSNLESWRKNWKRWPSTRWRAKGGRKKYGKGK
jgi:hypothetical protein